MEIFLSIQGEGAYLGMPATFIRTMGCNLKCSFCDTKQSWLGHESQCYTEMQIHEIVDKVVELNNKLVVITGGEPGIQKDLSDLVDALHYVGCNVAIETNGTMAIPHHVDWVTCSPKEDAGYRIDMLCKPSELKYVVTPTFNVDNAIPETIRQLYAGKIWLQPEGSDMQAMWQKCYQLVMQDKRLRVGIQLHKIMEVQ